LIAQVAVFETGFFEQGGGKVGALPGGASIYWIAS
jgi:hypothetical protein